MDVPVNFEVPARPVTITHPCANMQGTLIRPICDNLGLTLAGQRERINRDPVLSDVVTSVSVTLTQQAREMLCLPLKFIPGWLFGINANRVKPELRDRIIRYQRECFDVLAEAFVEGRLTAEPSFDDLMSSDSPAVQAYKMATAIMHISRPQRHFLTERHRLPYRTCLMSRLFITWRITEAVL